MLPFQMPSASAALTVVTVGISLMVMMKSYRDGRKTPTSPEPIQPTKRPKKSKRAHRRTEPVTIELAKQVIEEYCAAKTPITNKDDPYMPVYSPHPSIEGQNWIGSKVMLPLEMPVEYDGETPVCGIGFHPDSREEAEKRAAFALCLALRRQIHQLLPEYQHFKGPEQVYDGKTAQREVVERMKKENNRQNTERELAKFAGFLALPGQDMGLFVGRLDVQMSPFRIPIPPCGTSILCRSCSNALVESEWLFYPFPVSFPDPPPIPPAGISIGFPEATYQQLSTFVPNPASAERFVEDVRMFTTGAPILGWQWSPIRCKSCADKGGVIGYSFHRILPLSNHVNHFLGLDARYCELGKLEMAGNSQRIQFNPYQPLGKGTEGKAFRGLFHTETGSQLAAIKQVPLNSDEKKKYVVRELELLQKAQHPNLVRYFDHASTEVHMYVAMELGSCNLEEWVKNSPKSLHDAKLLRDLSLQLLSGLKYLQYDIQECRHFTHRDLKPQNVLVFVKQDKSIQLKLCDFGLSKSWEEVKEDSQTGTGPLGTFAWMAPEIPDLSSDRNLKNKSYLKSDVWSMGAVIAFLHLKGIHPYQVYDEFNASKVHVSVVLNQRRPFTGEENIFARDLIDHMLEKDTKKRWNVKECLLHPYFWNEERGRYLLLEKLYKKRYDYELQSASFIDLSNGRTWEQEIPPEMHEWAGNTWKNYQFVSIESFARFIGNFLKHDHEDKNPVPTQLLGGLTSYEFVVEKWPQMIIWLGHTWIAEQRETKGMTKPLNSP